MIKRLQEINDLIGHLWNLIVVIFVFLLLVLLFVSSQNGRYYVNSNGLILDTRTGNCYTPADRMIRKPKPPSTK